MKRAGRIGTASQFRGRLPLARFVRAAKVAAPICLTRPAGGVALSVVWS